MSENRENERRKKNYFDCEWSGVKKIDNSTKKCVYSILGLINFLFLKINAHVTFFFIAICGFVI